MELSRSVISKANRTVYAILAASMLSGLPLARANVRQEQGDNFEKFPLTSRTMPELPGLKHYKAPTNQTAEKLATQLKDSSFDYGWARLATARNGDTRAGLQRDP